MDEIINLFETCDCCKRKQFKNHGTIRPLDYWNKPGKYGTYKKHWYSPTYYYKYGEYWTPEWKGNKVYFIYHEY